MAIYPDGCCGLAGSVNGSIPGLCGWSDSDPNTVIHELGHLLGLYHPYNGAATDKSDVVNTNHPNCDGVNVECDCTLTGDMCCDTPATCKGIYDACSGDLIGTPVDRFGTPYPDDVAIGQIIVSNFMSQSDECFGQFTSDQSERMKAFISVGPTGEVECPQNPIENFENGGFISGQTVEINGKDLVPGRPYRLKDAMLILNDCTVALHDKANFHLENSVLRLNNTQVIRNGDAGCGEELNLINDGIVRSHLGQNNIFLFNNSSIEGDEPIKGGNQAATHVELDASYLISTDAVAITQSGGSVIANSESVITGTIRMDSGGVDPWLALINSFVKKAPNQGSLGIFTNGGIALFSNTYTETTSINLRDMDEVLMKNNSRFFHGIGYNFDVESKMLTMKHCYFAGYQVKAINPISYEILNNEFDAGNRSSALTIDGESSDENLVHKNSVKANNSGITTFGAQSGTTFICNEFEECVQSNFFWKNEVSDLQGQANDVSSGNKLSTSNFQIDGDSPLSITYNHLNNPDEEVSTKDNDNVEPTIVDLGAEECDIIGPLWCQNDGEPCPIGIDCTEPCPEGIDCSQACPLGIVCNEECPKGIICTEDCPLGIVCTEDCPEGIDCTVDCPTGIDCTEPCPPGINCDEPCPPGINCLVPCPPNVDCSEPCYYYHKGQKYPCTGIWIHEEGPQHEEEGDGGESSIVIRPLIYVKERYDYYKALNAQLHDELIAGSENSSLDATLNNQNSSTVGDILETLNSNSDFVTAERTLSIFKNSHEYTEQEVFNVISLNPVVLYDNEVNRIVFGTESFNEDNKAELLNMRNSVNNSPDIFTIWNMKAVKNRQSRLKRFALSQLHYYKSPKSEVNIWLEDSNDLGVLLLKADNIFEAGDYIAWENVMQTILSNEHLNDNEQVDAESYYAVMNVIKRLRQEGLDYMALTDIEFNLLENTSNSPHRYAGEKARTYLISNFGMEFGDREISSNKNERIYFKDSWVQKTSNRAISSKVDVYPNPSSGLVFVKNNYNEEVNISIFNPDGKVVISANINASETLELKDRLSAGLYLYTIFSVSGEAIHASKLIIID